MVITQVLNALDCVRVRFTAHTRDPQWPTKGSAGASGYDLYADLGTPDGVAYIGKDRIWQLHTGIGIELPRGYEAQIRSRSGLARQGLVVANSPGTIDSDYDGEIQVLLRNVSRSDVCQPNQIIHHGDRIAQLVISPVARPVVSYGLPTRNTKRGSNGFGSTGR